MKLFELTDIVSRMITAENPHGLKGEACKAEDGVTKHFTRNLGKGWKMSPCIDILSYDSLILNISYLRGTSLSYKMAISRSASWAAMKIHLFLLAYLIAPLEILLFLYTHLSMPTDYLHHDHSLPW